MAVAPKLIIFGTDNKPLVGPLPIPDTEIPDLTGCDAYEFNHRVWSYTKDDQITFGEILIRVHEPMRILKQIDCCSVQLFKFLTLGTYLPKAEIRWYQYDEEKHKQTEYFRMTLEHLRIKSIRITMPNVKDNSKAQYNHLEELQLVYQRITWLHPKGYLCHMDEWNNGFFSEENESDLSGKKTDETENAETAIIVDSFKVVFKKGTFTEPQGGFDFAKKVVIQFSASVNRKFNSKEGKVFAKLYAKYNGKAEDLRQINEGTLLENGSWQTEFTLQKPASYEKDANKKSDAIVEYYTEIESKYASAPFRSESVKVPSLKIPQLDIEHLYHDNEPVQNADFEIELENGTTQQEKLDNAGKAVVKDLESKPVRVRFGPDTRDYARVDSRQNENFLEIFTQQDATNVVDSGIAHEERPPEHKSIITDSISFVWGTLQGSFNQKQSVSQIIVDAVIGIIPVVGDVTAARDLIAIIIRLSLQPEKRKESLEWAGLVLMLFALIPVAGGVIKGVGRLLLKSGKEVAKISDFIAVLNRIGFGNAEKFIKELNLTKYLPDLMGKWRNLLQRIDEVLQITLSKMKLLMPKQMIEHIQQIQKGIREIKELGEKMIPESVKELDNKLKAIQEQIYKGEWHEVPKTLKSKTREIEARLVTTKDGKKEWKVERMDFPQNEETVFKPVPPFPNLKDLKFKTDDGTCWAIKAFSGPMHAVKLPPGTKIVRVIEPQKDPIGYWWTYKLPKDGKAWREDCAVLEHWSKNGAYVEYIVKEPGLYVWEGKISSQIDNVDKSLTSGQYLRGGETQLFIDFGNSQNSKFKDAINALPKKNTNWGDSHLGINIPEKGVTVQHLAAVEIAPKINLVAATSDRALNVTEQKEFSLK